MAFTFGFTVPSLPKEDYQFINAVRDQYEVTQRDVIIAALQALRYLAQVDRAMVDTLLTPTKTPQGMLAK